ncbi:phage major capsid protein [Sphaerisporangium sp. NPDC049002]|uniref:phage major capsid protein n=1 Tax=Sphaerisporangium sp. NPDC049002 TaxID=3155392 RepID=UPI0033C68B11
MKTAVKDRLKELNGALQVKARELDEASNGWTIEDGNVVVSTEQHAAYVKAINEAEEIKRLIMTEEQGAGIFDFLSGANGTPAAAQEAAAQGRTLVSSKSLADMWFESDEFAEMKSSGFRNFGHTTQFDQGLYSFERKDVFSAMAGTTTINTLGTAQNLGFTPRMLRPGRVRDLFPAETTTANLLFGMRETGFTNRAAVVPERRAADGVSPPTGGPTDVYALKPRSDLSIVPVTYPIATIAHIIYAHRNTLDDEPRMRGIIDRDMIDGIKMTEDAQLLYGDGVGDNLTGLFNTSGVQTYVGLNTDPRTAQIRRAMTRAILAYFNPNGVVLHPLDWEDLELERDNTGAYRLAVNVAIGGEKRVWRMDVIDTPVIEEGRYILGAWGTGAKLYDRQQVNIQVSTENRDMFERNAVTIRCEERLGLVVDRPESFVIGTLTTPAP